MVVTGATVVVGIEVAHVEVAGTKIVAGANVTAIGVHSHLEALLISIRRCLRYIGGGVGRWFGETKPLRLRYRVGVCGSSAAIVCGQGKTLTKLHCRCGCKRRSSKCGCGSV